MMDLKSRFASLPELLPRPSIYYQPNTVVRRGQPVTIVCQSPAGAETFRLEEKNRRIVHRDERTKSQNGTEARFHITEVIAGSYFCRYYKAGRWSECSEHLELVVTNEDVSTLPSGLS